MYQQMPPYPPYQQPYQQPPQPPQPPQSAYLPYEQPPYGYQAPRKGGLRAWAVVLIALGAFLIGIYVGTMIVNFNRAMSQVQNYDWSQYGDSDGNETAASYGLNETATVNGTLYDVSFATCSFDADISMTSYLRGDEAAAKIKEMGGDLSSLPDGKEYVTANFQVTLNSTDSSAAVMFNPQYFRFNIAESSDDVRVGNYPKNGIEVENLSLKSGESGTVTAFAVIDQSLADPELYFYTGDAYLTFTR